MRRILSDKCQVTVSLSNLTQVSSIVAGTKLTYPSAISSEEMINFQKEKVMEELKKAEEKKEKEKQRKEAAIQKENERLRLA